MGLPPVAPDVFEEFLPLSFCHHVIFLLDFSALGVSGCGSWCLQSNWEGGNIQQKNQKG